MPGVMEPSPRRRYPVKSRDQGSVPVPVERINHRDTPCDKCRYGTAKFEVIVIVGNVAKSLFFCGHHYHASRIDFAERGYEVKEIGLWLTLLPKTGPSWKFSRNRSLSGIS